MGVERAAGVEQSLRLGERLQWWQHEVVRHPFDAWGVTRQRTAEAVARPVGAGPAGGVPVPVGHVDADVGSVWSAPGSASHWVTTVVNVDGSSSGTKWPTPGTRCHR